MSDGYLQWLLVPTDYGQGLTDAEIDLIAQCVNLALINQKNKNSKESIALSRVVTKLGLVVATARRRLKRGAA